MTASPPDSPRPAPAWKPLEARERRVLGVLIEKAKTTPAAYPMTVNAIVAGCNQKSNRDPLTAYDDDDVENALRELSSLGAASEIDWLGRVPKYKHHAYEWLGVSKVELAVLAELLLRGAQALGELRGRAARMEPIADIGVLRPIIDGLIERGLMIELSPPGRGQIVSHNLYTAPELAELRAGSAGVAPRAIGSASGAPAIAAERSSEVAELRAEITRLAERIAELERRLGTAGE